VAYYNLMISRIKANWVWAGQETDNLAVTLRFGIEPDGRVVGVSTASSSGNPRFDHSVLSAVKAIRDLGPPPEQHRREFADVELVFRASDLTR
jgi:TonB family protein